MNTALLDAAFRLVSHSLLVQAANNVAPRTDGERLIALNVHLSDVEHVVIAEALTHSQKREHTVIEMSDVERGRAGDGSHGPELNWETLAERCLRFSDGSYGRAVEDGFMLTRK